MATSKWAYACLPPGSPGSPLTLHSRAPRLDGLHSRRLILRATINNIRRIFTRTSPLRLSPVINIASLPLSEFFSFSSLPRSYRVSILHPRVSRAFSVRLYSPLPFLKLQVLTLYDEGFVYISCAVKCRILLPHFLHPSRRVSHL